MEIFKHLRDPVYVLRPQQILRRVWYLLRSPSGQVRTVLPWGDRLEVKADETNGRTILERGLDQLTVVEACIRLMEPGGLAVDVGANYGQMMLALARGGKPDATVYAFEPHPRLFEYLSRNAAPYPAAMPLQKAVSARSGTATLHVPRTWRSDAGVSSLNPNFRGNTREVEVEATCLDEEFRGEEILVLKVDVEGHEESVFAGGERLLSDGKIKHIIFEEHSYEGSEAIRILKRNKYSIY